MHKAEGRNVEIESDSESQRSYRQNRTVVDTRRSPNRDELEDQ